MSDEPINVALERARTPGCATGHHLNAAGAALQSSITLETVLEYLRVEAFTGGYEAAREAMERVERTYAAIATLTGAAVDEVAIVESATRAWQSVVGAMRLDRGDRVIVTRTEYVSNALMLLALERERGIVLEVIDPLPDGTVDLAQMEAALSAGPAAMVAVGHIPTFSALVEPVAEVGALARRFGVPFVLDATQSLGQLPVDVEAIGCDALVSTGRKFLRGPRGTGILIVRRPLLDRLEPVAPDVRGATWTTERGYELKDSARRFETFEHSPALRLGLGVAIEQVLSLGVDAIAARIGELADELRARLAQTPGVTLADPPARAGGIVTFTVEGMDPAAVVEHLAEHRVHVVSVPASHGRWELDRRELDAVVRASVHIYNDPSDFDALVDALSQIPARVQAEA
jgi:selenocysteine lyase/cysteine desulfurase